MQITLVTENWAKIAQAKLFLNPLGIEVNNAPIKTIEIQSDSIEEVAKYSAKDASEKLKSNVVKNDTGLIIEALNGFPAAYTHYVQETIGEDGILKLLEGVENRAAFILQALAFCEYGKEPVVFSSKTKGTISLEKQGKNGWFFDYIFIPDGQTKTLACFQSEERLKLWNGTSYKMLVEHLKKDSMAKR